MIYRRFSFLMSLNHFVQKITLENQSACANVTTTVFKTLSKSSHYLCYTTIFLSMSFQILDVLKVPKNETEKFNKQKKIKRES